MAIALVQEKIESKTRAVARGSVPLPPVLQLFWAGSVVAFLLMILISYVEYRMGYRPPHYNPLSGDRYQDLMEFPTVYRLLHTAAFFTGVGNSRVAYPPLGAVVYALVYATGHPVVFYLATAAVWLLAAVCVVRRELMAQGIAALTATLFPLTVVLMSFPIAGMLQRGNIELFLWPIAALGTWAFFRGHEDRAAVLWGLAAAMKLYPIIFLALLLPRHKWRAFAVGIATFVGASMLAMTWLGPTMGIALRGSMNNVFHYQGVRVSEWTLHELLANHSAFNLFKTVVLALGLPPSGITLPYYAGGALLIAVAFFARLWKMPAANQLLALTAFMLIFPPISYFYTLVHLYAPWLVLVFLAIRAEKAKLTMLLFVPIFASYMLFTFPRVFLFGGLIQGCLILWLFGCALCFPFEADQGREPIAA